MKFKGQGKINICGFEYKKKLQTAVGGVSEHPKKTPVSAPECERDSFRVAQGEDWARTGIYSQSTRM